MIKNELPELLTDKEYAELTEWNLIHKINLRNYKLRKEFLELREKPGFSLDILYKKYPDIKMESLKKIIYRKL